MRWNVAPRNFSALIFLYFMQVLVDYMDWKLSKL